MQANGSLQTYTGAAFEAERNRLIEMGVIHSNWTAEEAKAYILRFQNIPGASIFSYDQEGVLTLSKIGATASALSQAKIEFIDNLLRVVEGESITENAYPNLISLIENFQPYVRYAQKSQQDYTLEDFKSDFQKKIVDKGGFYNCPHGDVIKLLTQSGFFFGSSNIMLFRPSSNIGSLQSNFVVHFVDGQGQPGSISRYEVIKIGDSFDSRSVAIVNKPSKQSYEYISPNLDALLSSIKSYTLAVPSSQQLVDAHRAFDNTLNTVTSPFAAVQMRRNKTERYPLLLRDNDEGCCSCQ